MDARACPWDSLAPATLQFCEAPVCGWVVEPSNTFSNAAFLVAGAYLWRQARRDGREDLRILALIAALTGLGSAFFHGSRTFVGEVVDFSAMFLQSGFLLAFALSRLRPFQRSTILAAYVAIVAISIALLVAYRTIGIPLFMAHVAAWAVLEGWLWIRDHARARYADLGRAGIVFGASYAIWWLDKLGIACRPDNHWVTGHAVWHALGAVTLVLLYRFCRQFDAAATR